MLSLPLSQRQCPTRSSAKCVWLNRTHLFELRKPQPNWVTLGTTLWRNASSWHNWLVVALPSRMWSVLFSFDDTAAVGLCGIRAAAAQEKQAHDLVYSENIIGLCGRPLHNTSTWCWFRMWCLLWAWLDYHNHKERFESQRLCLGNI